MQGEIIKSCMAYSNERKNVGQGIGTLLGVSAGGATSNAVLEALGIQRKRLQKLKTGKGGGVFSAILGNKEKEDKEAAG